MSQATGLAPDMMDMVVETLHEVLQRHLSDERMLELDAKEEFPSDVVKELLSPDVGMHLLFLPEEVGGLGGGSRRRLPRLGGDGLRRPRCRHRVPGDLPRHRAASLVGGTPEQKELWLGPRGLRRARSSRTASRSPGPAATSPTSRRRRNPSLDAAGAVTAYRLDGTKQFITNGGVADLYTILARAPGGPTFFVIERSAPGLGVGKKEDKHGIRASNTTSVVMDNVLVPADQLIGGVEGEGLKQASAVFGHTRLMVGAFGLGAGRNAIERAVKYAHEREQFGGPLIDKEGFALKLLVPHVVDLAAGRAYLDEIAARLDAEESDLPVEGAIAKYWCTEAGNRAADAAVQAHGGYGYMREYLVEKIRRDVRITNIYEGTSEILQSVIGMNRWKDHVRSKGGFYGGIAASLEALHARYPDVGAGDVAVAAHGLGDVLSYAQQHRLPRHQVVLFALADLATRVEVAAALCRLAAAEAERGDGPAGVTSAMGRVFARETLSEMSRIGRLCAVGFTERDEAYAIDTARPLMDRLAPGEDLARMTGQWLDMIEVAKSLKRS